MNDLTGYISIHRQIKKHWLYQKKPFCPLAAWYDLILNAQRFNKKEKIGKKTIMVNVGELVTTTYKLAELWGWSDFRVRDFLKRLKNDGMIELINQSQESSQKGSQRSTHILINNYADFQHVTSQDESQNSSRTHRKHPIETPVNTDFQTANNNIDNNINNITTTTNNNKNLAREHGKNTDNNCSKLAIKEKTLAMNKTEKTFSDCSNVAIKENEELKFEIIKTLKSWNYAGIDSLFKKHSLEKIKIAIKITEKQKPESNRGYLYKLLTENEHLQYEEDTKDNPRLKELEALFNECWADSSRHDEAEIYRQQIIKIKQNTS